MASSLPIGVYILPAYIAWSKFDIIYYSLCHPTMSENRPAIIDASPPSDDPNANVILCSSDNVDFRVFQVSGFTCILEVGPCAIVVGSGEQVWCRSGGEMGQYVTCCTAFFREFPLSWYTPLYANGIYRRKQRHQRSSLSVSRSSGSRLEMN